MKNRGMRHTMKSFDVIMSMPNGSIYDKSCNVCKHKRTKVCDNCTGYPGSNFERKK